MKKMSYLILLFCPALLHGSWVKNYWYGYRAASAMEAKNYAAAGDLYTKALSSAPYGSQTNYNMGLALYGQKKYDSAANYFERSATHAKQNLKLKEQALFNLGDAQVHDKKLHEALASFGKVIDLNPKNDRARHNLEYAKQLLAKEAQERQKQDPKDQKDQKDQQDDSKKQPKGEPKDQEKSQKQDGQKSEKSENDCQKSDKREDQQEKSDGGSSDEKNKKEDVAKDLKKSKEKSEEEKSKPEGKQDEKTKLGDSDKKSGESKNEAASEGSGLANEHQAEVMQKPEDDERLDKRAVMVMQEMQKQEDNIQKQLLKMNVSKQGAFGHGQKNW